MTGSLETELKHELEKLIDEFVVKGMTSQRVLDVIEQELDFAREGYERDPDPAEDETITVTEPANDWPGADKV